MTHSIERHHHAHHHDHDHRNRHAGVRVLDRVDVRRPDAKTSERERSLTEQLRAGARGATIGHLRRVRDLYQRERRAQLPMNADTVRLAYIAQRGRLSDERVTDEMTRSQLTSELMAKAILFAPQVSDALKTRHHHESRAILSQYNDVIGEIVRSLPSKLVPGYKTAVVDAIRFESLALNQQIGHSSEISGKDSETGLVELLTIMNGISYEVAPENGLARDPNLEVIIPKDTESDLAGIDMIVKRKDDGKMALVDSKTRGSYLSTVAKYEGVDWVDEKRVGPYYFTEMEEWNGNLYPHYLLNANAFGQIPAEDFDYTPAGQDKLRRTVHQMLDE